MAKAELKTKKTTASVASFLSAIPDDARREDCRRLVKLMQQAIGAEPKMWGEHVIGFGDYHYKYESGRENDWFVAGFSPRKANITLYLMSGAARHSAILERLGKHKVGKGCLYIKQLSDIELPVLKELVESCARELKKKSVS